MIATQKQAIAAKILEIMINKALLPILSITKPKRGLRNADIK
jgi:hypothetical protein